MHINNLKSVRCKAEAAMRKGKGLDRTRTKIKTGRTPQQPSTGNLESGGCSALNHCLGPLLHLQRWCKSELRCLWSRPGPEEPTGRAAGDAPVFGFLPPV